MGKNIESECKSTENIHPQEQVSVCYYIKSDLGYILQYGCYPFLTIWDKCKQGFARKMQESESEMMDLSNETNKEVKMGERAKKCWLLGE